MNKETETGTTVGLSEESHHILRRLQEDGAFAELVDGYRFAVALALAKGGLATHVPKRRTLLNVGSFDPDGEIATAIELLVEEIEGGVYKTAERLAEWGVQELGRIAEEGEIRFTDVLKEVRDVWGKRACS